MIGRSVVGPYYDMSSYDPLVRVLPPQEAEWRKREAGLIAAEQQQQQRADRLQAERDAQQQHIDKLER